MSLQEFLGEIRRFLGDSQIVLDRESLSHFSYDATERQYMPQVALLPESTEDVSRIMKCACLHRVPVTPQGGRTGLSGGALPVRGGVVLLFAHLNRILEIDEANMFAVVEPGVVSNDLQIELNGRGLFFPPDPSSTVDSTLGGNVAENAGYTRAVKYGVTRDYVRGLEAVLPSGEVITLGGKTVKNVAGYDLISLIVGSEGTLAVITKITLRLLMRPRVRRTVIAYLNDLRDAADLIVAVFRSGIVPCAIELMDNIAINTVADHLGAPLPRDAAALVLIETDGHGEEEVEAQALEIARLCLRSAGVTDARLTKDEAEAERFWTYRREVLPSLKALGKDHLEADVVVPRYNLPFLVRFTGELKHSDAIKIATYGHAGDGNLHVTILHRRRNFAELEEAYNLLELIYRETISMGGSLTGEHGVGLTVMDYLPMQIEGEALPLMRRVKAAFDPAGILNPGKIFKDSIVMEKLVHD
ncbi:MAG: FAD-linked oxidase C-terminal domain-containing protein [Syntrophorhabdaceae bacterium]|nr:FAD-linked oxidase C-terminal domain-containing protein [Syntrophorhabdaceae bacterium]